jgi:hypothetical protein
LVSFHLKKAENTLIYAQRYLSVDPNSKQARFLEIMALNKGDQENLVSKLKEELCCFPAYEMLYIMLAVEAPLKEVR